MPIFVHLVPAPLLCRRDGSSRGRRGQRRNWISQAVLGARPYGAPKGSVELRAGAIGAHLLKDVEGFTHASALVCAVFADEHVHNNICRPLIDNALCAHTTAEFDALTIIGGDVHLNSLERDVVQFGEHVEAHPFVFVFFQLRIPVSNGIRHFL